MRLAIALVAGIVLLWLGDRLARAAEERGWIYYRKRRGRAATGNALLEVHALLEPDRRGALQMRTAVDDESPRSGDPPPGDFEEGGAADGGEVADLGARR